MPITKVIAKQMMVPHVKTAIKNYSFKYIVNLENSCNIMLSFKTIQNLYKYKFIMKILL